MELRTLRYFLEAAREENMTRAAENLHVSQPTLSKQLRKLEEELGKQLFIRHSFSIELTKEGMLLRKRAEDIVAMSDKVEAEFLAMDDIVGGNIYFGCAESYQIRHLAKAIKTFKRCYPQFHYHITSGDTQQVLERLDKGLLDFAMIVERPDEEKYHVLKMPGADRWENRCFVHSKAGTRIFPDGAARNKNSCSWKGHFVFPITVRSLPKKALAIF